MACGEAEGATLVLVAAGDDAHIGIVTGTACPVDIGDKPK
jgi:hypothetical protein